MTAGALAPVDASAQEGTRLYLGTDKSHVLALGEPARKVAVANPNIADVQVINPSQLLIVGKAPGATSLVVFSAKAPQYFEIVVHPSPMSGAAVSSGTEPYAVLVQRGGHMSEQVFARDQDQRWVELGQIKPETTEPGKK
jgi:hypothetical protein